jgi:FixJ family two-component response regulator
MGRPIGSVNRQKPFTDALRVALLSGGGRRLRIIADKLVEKAEQGDLQAIREVADRLDGNTNKQAASALGGTERTIKAHRHRVMEKMQVRSIGELVSLAERVGVLSGASGNRPRV